VKSPNVSMDPVKAGCPSDRQTDCATGRRVRIGGNACAARVIPLTGRCLIQKASVCICASMSVE